MEESNKIILDGIPLGRWNIQYIALMSMIYISGPVQYYNSVFTNKFINHTCSTNKDELYDFNGCTTNNSQECNAYAFDPSEERTTFTTEFNLVCEDKWISDLFQLILTIGCLVGAAFTGLGDIYGRRDVLRVSSIIHVLSILVIGLSQYPFIILGGRFFVGLSYTLLSSTSYILLTETTPPNRRSLVCFLVQLVFYITVIMIGVVAYFITEWRHFFLVLSALPILLPLLAFYIDESPQWLHQKSRIEEAQAILVNAASLNHGTVNYTLNQIVIPDLYTQIQNDTHQNLINYIKTFFTNFFGTKAMVKISIVMPLIWFMMATAYFGVPLNAQNFTDNTNLYMIIVGAAELPVSICGSLIVNKVNNINTGTGIFAILGLSMLGIMNLKNHNMWWIKWVLIALSMNCIGLLNCLVQLMTCELFPTTLRTTAFSFCAMCYYIGFFTASYINSLSRSTYWWLYYAICCISCLLGSILIRFVPETNGSKLCNTIEDVVQRDHGCILPSNSTKLQEK